MFEMDEGPRSRMEKLDSSIKLVEAVNQLLEAETKAQNVYDDALTIKFCDLIKVDDKCLKINPEKFAVFMKQNKIALDTDCDQINPVQQQLLLMIKSLQGINQMISGKAVEAN